VIVQEDHPRHLTIAPNVIGLLTRKLRGLLHMMDVPGRHHRRGIVLLAEDVLPLSLLWNGHRTLPVIVQEDHLWHLTIAPNVIGLLARKLHGLPHMMDVPGRHHRRGIVLLAEDVLPLSPLIIVREMDDHLLGVRHHRRHPLVDEQTVLPQGQRPRHLRKYQNPAQQPLERSRDKVHTSHQLHYQDKALREAEVSVPLIYLREVVQIGPPVRNRRKSVIVAFRAREAVEKVWIQSQIRFLVVIQTV
jgi:hypothetical protein